MSVIEKAQWAQLRTELQEIRCSELDPSYWWWDVSCTNQTQPWSDGGLIVFVITEATMELYLVTELILLRLRIDSCTLLV